MVTDKQHIIHLFGTSTYFLQIYLPRGLLLVDEGDRILISKDVMRRSIASMINTSRLLYDIDVLLTTAFYV